ncbi:ABC transporter substrate-binding protein [Paenibacillus sambharensis]|uniref:ABC transporter substrate-binding protein n=1 Tax=Paenibacillus sambharensis TaxID=1803190 RepID=A0A2W1LBB0_9BACL|nr:extracellular solute-binding protein [Paenibacillus sambharensis]PZD95410.1 ABC transporter substrate-binding protein [Paenibacillus sambharensis]
MKRRLSLMLCTLVAAMSLAACGNGNNAGNAGSTGGNAGAGSNVEAAANTANEPQKEAPSYKVTIATAGDTNMTELQEEAIVPGFKELYPGSEINVVGTGAGDAGSQKIFEKLKAQKDAGKTEWDIDVAIVHQSMMKSLIENDLLDQYVPMSANKDYVVSADSKNSLGTNVEGYVIPLFHSQIALAYNPDKVTEVPDNFDQLEQWIKDNPKRFGYNGVLNGMSGVGFVTAYAYHKTGDYTQLTEGPYDAELEKKWPAVMKELKALPATITNGNNGTLDMLNRGEIDMGPVWVDMFQLWISEGRLNPSLKLKLPVPGLPGQPMYIVIPKNAKNKEAALKYADYLSSPEVQAEVIVGRNTWYPGIDANVVLEKASAEAKEQLFSDISADDLNSRGQSLPLTDYFKNLQTAYETN